VNTENPKVSIGLPTYNSIKYIRNTLESILNQTFSNFVLHISDDNSTDGTDNVCEEYANKDSRIKFSKNEHNIGPHLNHLKVFIHENYDYFMFARGHERLSHNFLECCINTLDKNEESILAFGTPKWIDQDNKVLIDKPYSYYDSRGLSVNIRVAFSIWGRPEYNYGLIRTKALIKKPYFRKVIGEDHIIMLRLALMGSFAHAKKCTRYRRYLYENETYKKRIKRYLKSSYRVNNKFDYYFPHARLPFYLFHTIYVSNIKRIDKFISLLIIIVSLPIKFVVLRGKKL